MVGDKENGEKGECEGEEADPAFAAMEQEFRKVYSTHFRTNNIMM